MFLRVSFSDREMILPLCNNYSEVDVGCPVIVSRKTENDDVVVLAIRNGDLIFPIQRSGKIILLLVMSSLQISEWFPQTVSERVSYTGRLPRCP